MQNVEKLSIALTPEMAGMVKQAVRSGEYASSSEVIREALRLWRDHQQARTQEVEALRRAWGEGVASGPSSRTVTEIIAEGRARLNQQG
ncbi:type II toxin-antitoxin system ParD family antitoxin (plasmid) [Skermanella mucosa]|uniref:type II toxin-antitoxin system ParD family antitoxin n=1 Tax=Skermanella mucosa TaxID=1789672 RepID=UPI00192CAC1B|nr:type II toxin-antitoxin system ParD family antitoxin [Skermanella mucosa]UEM25436.1 type II toxin-antitoxin system ParD family antitoxin [Skermanella mucosa]